MRFFRSSVVPAAALAVVTALSPLALSPSLLAPANAAPAVAAPAVPAVRTAPRVPEAPVHAAQAPALPATAHHKPFKAAGKNSSYHIYTNGIDRSKAVGVLFYLGGDYDNPGETWVHSPKGTALTELAAQARKKNMILVVPISPDHNPKPNGITWWEDADGNGDYFRALKDSLVKTYDLDTSRVWLAGYSGGAEFITYELLADRQNWIRGGGATIIGGGGASGMQTAPSAAVRSLPITWYAGTKDVVGSTNPPTWSASAAAAQGMKRFRADGFTRTSLKTLQGYDHEDYDIVGLIAQGLATLPPAPTTSTGQTATLGTPQAAWLRGAIRTDYFASGGAGTYGQPTSAEKPTGRAGGVYQGFTKNYTYYWSPATGAHPVKWGTGIGNAYKAAGLERGWGYPVMAERKIPGGAYQDFRNGTARYRAMYSPATGTRVIKLSGGIGTAWQKAGHEHAWGYPATDEYAVAGGMAQRFSRGVVATWHRSTGKVTVSRG
ncbi:hypothetical protein [Kocuria marina]|uniref:hypothetical protein n=1 Tax=Kocuria marina TaxID=223184 RepID=UPI00192F9363|nr:hypothetical protein [Kocuria indica]